MKGNNTAQPTWETHGALTVSILGVASQPTIIYNEQFIKSVLNVFLLTYNWVFSHCNAESLPSIFLYINSWRNVTNIATALLIFKPWT